MSTDTGNGQYGSAASDGQTLVIDAAKAQLNPPPESRSQAADYKAWMRQAGDVGGAWAQYDPATAEAAAESARYKPAVQAANDKCVAEGAA